MAFDKVTRLVLGLSFFCIVLTLVAIGAHAADNTDAPPAAQAAATEQADPVHSLISRQLEAIRARDADQAYALTTENFHRKYETAKEFLSHLRFNLRPVYNNEDVKFLAKSETEDGFIQRVEIDEHSGEPVTVIYRAEEQDNGEYLIDSFAVIDTYEADPI